MMEVPAGEREQKLWLAERARELLQSVPITKGDTVVDFGCGTGTYALPAAELVGAEGTVYALDCDCERLRPVEQADCAALNPIHGDGTTHIPLEDASCDVGLLFDVLQKLDDRRSVMAQMYRVIRPGGVLSVYPMHLDPQQIRAEVVEEGFSYRDDFAGLVLHFISD